MTIDVVSLDEGGGFSLSAKILQETGWKTGDKLTVEIVGNKLHVYSVERAPRNTREETARGISAAFEPGGRVDS